MRMRSREILPVTAAFLAMFVLRLLSLATRVLSDLNERPFRVPPAERLRDGGHLSVAKRELFQGDNLHTHTHTQPDGRRRKSFPYTRCHYR